MKKIEFDAAFAAINYRSAEAVAEPKTAKRKGAK